MSLLSWGPGGNRKENKPQQVAWELEDTPIQYQGPKRDKKSSELSFLVTSVLQWPKARKQFSVAFLSRCHPLEFHRNS